MKIIAYWNGPLPSVTKLFFISFLSTQKGHELNLYVENNFSIQDDELKAIVDNPRIKIIPIDMLELLKDSPIKCFIVRPNNLQITIRRLIKYFYNRIFYKFSKRYPEKNLIHGYLSRPLCYTGKYLPLLGSGDWGLPFLSDVFRVHMTSTLQEDFVYADVDFCFLRDVSEYIGSKPFTYQWANESFANSAFLFCPAGSGAKNLIVKKAVELGTTLPWILFTIQNCKELGIDVLPCKGFDPIWDNSYDNHGYDFDIFFKKTEFSEELFNYLMKNCNAYHWHNRWKILPEKGSPYDLLMQTFHRPNSE